jgi:hypothetical protein
MRSATNSLRWALALSVCVLAAGQESTHKFQYDKTKEVKLQGTVTELVKQEGCDVRFDQATHLKVADAAAKTTPGAAVETVDVFVGPGWFLKEMDISLAKDDRLEITGVWFEQDDKKMFVARLVKKNKDEFLLRDETGAPVWTWLDGYKTCKTPK